MPCLLRGLARTAVVAGTATAVSDRVSRRQANGWTDQQTRYAPEADASPQRTGTSTELAQLRELAPLRDSGILDEAEFQLPKSQILNS